MLDHQAVTELFNPATVEVQVRTFEASNVYDILVVLLICLHCKISLMIIKLIYIVHMISPDEL